MGLEKVADVRGNRKTNFFPLAGDPLLSRRRSVQVMSDAKCCRVSMRSVQVDLVFPRVHGSMKCHSPQMLSLKRVSRTVLDHRPGIEKSHGLVGYFDDIAAGRPRVGDKSHHPLSGILRVLFSRYTSFHYAQFLLKFSKTWNKTSPYLHF